jgi:hypothetical protein
MMRWCRSYIQLICSKYAIAGGNNEIVRILEQKKGISFDDCFAVGVLKYYRMDLCDWLLMLMKNEPLCLLKSLEYFNYAAFFSSQ